MTAMSTHLYARIESKVKFSKRIVDMSVLSEEELNEELEKGYADVQAGRTKDAKTAFDNIRKDYQLNTYKIVISLSFMIDCFFVKENKLDNQLAR